MNNDNNENNDGRSDDDGEEISSAKLFLASTVLLVFTLISAIVIVAWGPLLPEAVAVELNRGKTPFSEYVILHESWHSVASSRRALSCER